MIKIAKIPNKPGVYLIKDENGKVIYVGKAKSLRERVRAYFANTSSPKTQVIASKINDIDYIVTNSEVEALILEANLIKLHLPRYNIRLKDDKKYPYIKVTVQEDFPRVFPTRDLRDRSSIYFGPYTSVKTMKRALKSATEIFPIRTCKGRLPARVCLAYHIGRCYAPCEGKISKEEYQSIVQELIDFLSGKSKIVEQNLSSKMNKLASQLEFEEAARVRDRLISVQSIVKKQRVVFDKPVDLDVFGLQSRRAKACIGLILVREGRVLGSEHYILQIQPNTTLGEIIRAFILQYYKNAFFIPQEIVVPAIDEKEVIESWLKRKILLPKGGEKLELIRLAEKNAAFWFEAEKVEKAPKALDQLQTVLKLEKLPKRIEAFDVSNIGGKYAVGSCVSFVDGRAQKSGYRRFKIKTVEGIDDVSMIKEIVTRRVKRGGLPDLILIDGGLGQVRAAHEQIPSVPVFGLAKRFEELYTPDGKVISLPKDSLALRILQRVRDEAHRFAISYHKKLRDKPSSLLNEIPGIGGKRRQALLKHFSTFEQIKRASLKELQNVPGIGKTYAKQIYNFLHLEV
ncbi:MAG: excinuclease ABC subunit UvrC [bacterium]|nr:excinuclease ABC subunit UvrC [bacterium]